MMLQMMQSAIAFMVEGTMTPHVAEDVLGVLLYKLTNVKYTVRCVEDTLVVRT